MDIELHLDDDIKIQSIEAGYANVEDYLHSLLQRDRARLACLKGLQDVDTGNTRPFDEFDSELRRKHEIELEG